MPASYLPGITHSYKDMAVISRTAFNTRELEESLAARGVPYTVEGGSSFFSRSEVQAPLALLALCANPQVSLSYCNRAVGWMDFTASYYLGGEVSCRFMESTAPSVFFARCPLPTSTTT